MLTWIVDKLVATPIIGTILKSVFGFVLTWQKQKLDAQGSHEAQVVEVTKRAFDLDQREAELNARVVEEEQGRWYTALPRPLFAFAIVIYVWKLFVIDKVVGPGCVWWTSMCWKGTTDPLSPEMSTWAMVIITAYFGGRTLEKVAGKIAGIWR